MVHYDDWKVRVPHMYHQHNYTEICRKLILRSLKCVEKKKKSWVWKKALLTTWPNSHHSHCWKLMTSRFLFVISWAVICLFLSFRSSGSCPLIPRYSELAAQATDLYSSFNQSSSYSPKWTIFFSAHTCFPKASKKWLMLVINSPFLHTHFKDTCP